MTEQQNEELKLQSKAWWSSHSQDYVNPGERDHLGAPIHLDDNSFRKYLDYIDKNFAADGYFAQKRGDRLFSSLLPKDLRGKKVLEVGCGLGGHSEQLCNLGADLTAIDLAPMSITFTRRRLSLKKLKADVIEADCEQLPFDDNTFDFIWSWGVIHHSPNTKKCADEITRVLKPGGELRIMLYNQVSLYAWLNVFLRYGILRGKFFTHSFQDLKNRYTDGKSENGAPLSKYYSSKQIRKYLFPKLDFDLQVAFEQKHAATFWLPSRFQRAAQTFISDRLYTFIWRRFGFLLFSCGKKRGG